VAEAIKGKDLRDFKWTLAQATLTPSLSPLREREPLVENLRQGKGTGPMRIVVADSAGFCMGVRRAVDMALELMDRTQEPVCSIGPLIHNPQVVELLKKRGVRPALSLDEINKGIVIVRSHGISPALRKKLEARGIKILDATCPKVARVHHAVEKYSGLGYLVVVLGDPGHSEVEGILGFADNQAVVIQSAEDVKKLPDADQVILVAQTTQSSARFEEVASAMRERYSSLADDRLVIINTICDSTERKQEEVRELARKVDAFVVVGGKESANTRRLKEIAESEGKPAYLVESEDELDLEKIRGLFAVGLTAGASTPNWMIRRVYNKLRAAGLAGVKYPLRLLYKWVRSLTVFNLFLALGGALVCALAGRMITGEFNLHACAAAFFFISAVQGLSAFRSRLALQVVDPRGGYFSDPGFLYAALAGLVLGAGFALLVDLRALVFYAALAMMSIWLQGPWKTQAKPVGGARFRGLPGISEASSALAWAAMVVLVPLSGRAGDFARTDTWLLFTVFFLMAAGRGVLCEFQDPQADRMVGKETLPTLIGAERSRLLIHMLLGLAAVLAVSGFWLAGLGPAHAGILVGLVWLWACVPIFARTTVIQGLAAELVIDFSFILAGAAGLAISGLY